MDVLGWNKSNVCICLILIQRQCNFIRSTQEKNQKKILHEHTECHECLKDRGFNTKIHWSDNEASNALNKYNQNQGVDVQLFTPGVHQRNAVERSIKTWKNHFIAVLFSTDTKLPMHLFFCLLKKCTLALNLLRQIRRNLRMSPYIEL